MISVIIPVFEDEKYLLRCLSSLNRQTITDFEIIVSGNCCSRDIADRYGLRCIACEDDINNFCAALNTAIGNSLGEYIYFADINSVISPNTFEALLSRKEDSFLYAQQYLITGNGTQKIDDTLFSCFGKLFKKARLAERGIHFEGNCAVSEILFTSQYLNGLENFEEAGCYVYADAFSCLNNTLSADISTWENFIGIIKNLSGSIKDRVCAYIKNLLTNSAVCSEDLIFLLEDEFHDNYELNFAAAAAVLKELWREIKEDRNKNAFESFKRYLSKYESEPFYRILIKELGIDADSCNYLKEENVCNALFLYEQDLKFRAQEGNAVAKGQAAGPAASAAAASENGIFSMIKVNKKWRACFNGAVVPDFSGLAKNQYGWWYFKNGDVDLTYNGFAPKADGWYAIKDGKAVEKVDSDAILRAAEDKVRSELSFEQTKKFTEIIETLNADNLTEIMAESLEEAVKALQTTGKTEKFLNKADTLLKQSDSITVYKTASAKSKTISPEEVISAYREGRLGFKTLPKSFKAWLKFKIDRRD